MNTDDPTYMGVKNDTLDQVSTLPGSDSVFLHKYCPTFQRHYDHLQCWAWMTLKMKAPISFETPRTARLTIRHHVPQEWDCQQHQRLTCHSCRQVILIKNLIKLLLWRKLLHLFCVCVCVCMYVYVFWYHIKSMTEMSVPCTENGRIYGMSVWQWYYIQHIQELYCLFH